MILIWGMTVITVTEALTASRNLKSDEPKTIIIGGGFYYEFELDLEPLDSGLTIEAASGEKPVLYSGRLVTNWEKDGKFYTAKLDGVKDITWDFRNLVVNDKLRPRAWYSLVNCYM